MSHQSDEVILLTAFGTVLLVAGIAQRLQVSAAIGAFLVGIAVSGPMAEQSHRVFAPLRDFFAATFFFFFGLQIDPSTLMPALHSRSGWAWLPPQPRSSLDIGRLGAPAAIGRPDFEPERR